MLDVFIDGCYNGCTVKGGKANVESSEKFSILRKSIMNNRDLSGDQMKELWVFTEVLESIWDSIDDTPKQLHSLCNELKHKRKGDINGGEGTGNY